MSDFTPTDEELAVVSTLADKQWKLQADLEAAEQRVEDLKKELNLVRDRDLPNAIAEVGLSTFVLKNGRKVSVKTEVYASIPKDNTGPAFTWLRQNNHDAIIKNVISTEFGKGEDEAAIRAATILAEAGFRPVQKESVHPSTLKAFLKEQIGQGVDVPLDAFGAFIVNRAKVE